MNGRERRADRIALLVAMAIAAVAHGPMLAGHMPWSHDHPTHLYKAWAFWTQLLSQGQLRGWSPDWFFGYPAEELYPIGPDLWVAAVHALSLGLLDWEATYAVALGLAGVFVAAAIQTLGARTVGRWAGVLAAALWTLDLGAVREGGWIYLQLIGVWGQALSTGFFCFGLAFLWEATGGAGPRRLALAALSLAAALLTHGSATLLLVLLLPVVAIARGRARAAVVLPILAVAAALAGGLAGFWQLPMMARGSWSSDIGELGPPLGLMLSRFWTFGGPFREGHPSIGALVGVGLVAGLRGRLAGTRLLAGCAGVLLLFSSGTLYELVHLERFSPSFAKIQFQRMLIPAKVPWFLLAGAGAAALGAWLRDRLRAARAGEGTGPRQIAGALVIIALFGLLGRALADRAVTIGTRVYASLDLDGDPSWRAPYDQLAAWIKARRAEEGHFFRIAVDLGNADDHRGMALPVWTGVPTYKIGYTPANLYGPGPGVSSARVFQQLSVRWLVSASPLGASWLHEAARFGPMYVYSYGGYDPARAHVEGGGEVETLQLDNDSARFRISGAEPDSRLIVHVSAWPRWQMWQGGEPVAWVAVPPAPGLKPSLMSAPAADGELELRYVDLPEDRLGALASGLGLLGLGLLCAPGRRLMALRARLSAIASGLAEPATVGLIVLALAFGLYRQLRAPAVGPEIRPFDNDMTWLPSSFRSM